VIFPTRFQTKPNKEISIIDPKPNNSHETKKTFKGFYRGKPSVIISRHE